MNVKTNLKNNLDGLPPEQATMLGILTVALYDASLVTFEYDGKPRTVEVHAIGRSTKDGSLVMRAYQVDGESSRPVPGWSLFSLSKIDLFEMGVSRTRGGSEAPRDGYVMDDKQMSPVLAQIDTSV